MSKDRLREAVRVLYKCSNHLAWIVQLTAMNRRDDIDKAFNIESQKLLDEVEAAIKAAGG